VFISNTNPIGNTNGTCKISIGRCRDRRESHHQPDHPGWRLDAAFYKHSIAVSLIASQRLLTTDRKTPT
jgi:hypothetical protein